MLIAWTHSRAAVQVTRAVTQLLSVPIIMSAHSLLCVRHSVFARSAIARSATWLCRPEPHALKLRMIAHNQTMKVRVSRYDRDITNTPFDESKPHRQNECLLDAVHRTIPAYEVAETVKVLASWRWSMKRNPRRTSVSQPCQIFPRNSLDDPPHGRTFRSSIHRQGKRASTLLRQSLVWFWLR